MKITQKIVLAAIESVVAHHLGVRAERDKCFDWPVPTDIRKRLQAVILSKAKNLLRPSHATVIAHLYFPAPLHCIVQFDNARHCTRGRAATFAAYPPNTPLSFDVARYRADRTAGDINLAVADALADLLPPLNGLNPTVRLRADEIAERTGLLAQRVEELLSRRLAVHAGTEFQRMIDAAGGKPHREQGD